MSIASEITRIKNAVADAYQSCDEKGATMPAVENVDNLAETIDTITGGGAYSSVFFKNANFTNQGSVSMVGGGKTYNGRFVNMQVPNPEWVGLPKGYTQIESIEATGTQYINTGIRGSTDVVRGIYCDYIKSSGTYFIASYGLSQRFYALVNANCWFSKSGQSAITVYAINEPQLGVRYKYSLDISNNLVTVMEETSGGVSTAAINYTIDTEKNLFLFASNDSPITYCSGKVFKLIMYGPTQNELRHFIPCKRTSDNAIGMYDLVSETFFGNAGTGSFVAGAEVPQFIGDKGFLVYNVPFGTYTWTATQNGKTATGTILIDVVTEYEVDVALPLLPSTYQQLSYIESTGTQYIDTGYAPTSAYRSEVVAQFTKVDTSNNMKTEGFYYRGGGVSTATGFVLTSANKFNYPHYTSDNYNYTEFQNGDLLKHTFVLDYINYKASIDSSTIDIGPYWRSVPVSIFLFASNTEGSAQNKTHMKLYSVKYFEGSTLMHFFIPCYRKSDGEVGMYDMVSETFFINQGTGSFRMGAIVDDEFNATYQQVEYLQSDSNQYIDTGVTIANSNYSFDVLLELQIISSGNNQMGALAYSPPTDQRIHFGIDSGQYIVYYGTGSQHNEVNATTQGLCNATLKNGVIKMVTPNGTPQGSIINYPQVRFYLFARNNNGSLIKNAGWSRAYKAVFIDDSSNAKIFIPCYRISDNVAGMYDMVNKVFYTNQGTGTFTVGPDIDIEEAA